MFKYFLQTNFAGSPAILEPRMSYRFGSQFAADVGQFKSRYSEPMPESRLAAILLREKSSTHRSIPMRGPTAIPGNRGLPIYG